MFWHQRIQLTEPSWGEHTLLFLNGLLDKHSYLANIMPIASDIFVFFYPIFLVGLYLHGINNQTKKEREAALFIFCAGWASMLVNFVIKLIFTKTRPDVLLDLLYENREWLVLETLPKNTFPSDHAAMAFAIATATMIRGIKKERKHLIYLWVLLYVMACIMAFGRIMIGIHWPTDIIAGVVVGVVTPLILFYQPIQWSLDKHIIQPLITIQEWLRKVLRLSPKK